MADWSEINHDLLGEIAKRIKFYDDFVSLGSVCKSWKSGTLEDLRYKDRQTPWLMLHAPGDSEKEKFCDKLRCFYSISKGMRRPRQLGKAKWNRCFSSHGWLITICPNLSMSLLHPFSGVEVELPHISTSKDFFNISPYGNWGCRNISRCVLSSNPCFSSDYTLMIIMDRQRRLAYYRAGDKSWSSLIGGRPMTNRKYYQDIACYKGQFYAITSKRKIIACDIKSNTAQKVAALPPGQHLEILYLVESAGDLLVVSRQVERFQDNHSINRRFRTFRFKVFKVDLFNTKTCMEMNSLNNRAIFLGHYSSSFSVEAFPCLQPNSIYFTRDSALRYWALQEKDAGICNLQDGSIKSFSEADSYIYYDHFCHRPMWVEQSFQ